jgi:SAM-dependent methyltransferase
VAIADGRRMAADGETLTAGSAMIRMTKQIGEEDVVHADLATNKRAWDQIAHRFAGHCALPNWGPFGECRSTDLLGNVRGMTVLEVGCGSGDSIARVVECGARLVYGIDLSTTQIALATERNRGPIAAGRVHLIQVAMEKPLDLRDIDLIFSIYGIGWTRAPAATFRNLAAYLKRGSRLIWSWGHPLFPEVQSVDGKFILPESYSYFNEESQFASGWCGTEGTVVQNRMLSTWTRHMAEAGFVVRGLLEPEPESCPDWVFNNNRLIPMIRARLLPSTLVYVCEKV